MRICENGTCLRPAAWRSKTTRNSAANPHNDAWCDPCRIELGHKAEDLHQLLGPVITRLEHPVVVSSAPSTVLRPFGDK